VLYVRFQILCLVGCASMTLIQSAEFEMALTSELVRLGAFVTHGFRIPGTHREVDVYIASPVRAFVEIKLRASPILSDVQRALHQLEDLRREFGGEIVPIMIVGGESWGSSPITQELRDLGFFILNLDNSTPDVSPATYCAKEIHHFLMHLPYQFKGIEVSAARPLPAPPRPAPPDTDFLYDIDLSISDSISKSTSYAASQRIEPHSVESATRKPRSFPSLE
jgi:hypothetical protein